MEEYVDILDAHGAYTGKNCSKAAAHRYGYFHPTVHIWFYTENGEILIQKRADNKETFPGLWDISVAGHVSAGETLETAALREVKEEIGLDINLNSLTKIGVFKKEHRFAEDFMDAEFNHIFVAPLTVHFDKLQRQKEEVAALQLIAISDFENQLQGSAAKSYVPHPIRYYQLVISNIKSRLNQ